jgi:hypothetical protein
MSASVVQRGLLVNEAYHAAYVEQRVDRAVQALAAIVDAGGAQGLPRILGLALDPRRELAEAAGDAVQQLAQRVAVHELIALDHDFRASWHALYEQELRWWRLQPRELATLAALRAGPTLIQLAMLHGSGYIREHAIRFAAASSDGSELAFLLLRANDWVASVRVAAHGALRARLTARHVPDLVAALPLIDAMSTWQRASVSGIVGELEQRLWAPDAFAALEAAARGADRVLRRAAVRRLLDAPALQAAWIAAALEDPDPAIRMGVGWRLVNGEADAFAAHTDALLRSGFSAIRYAAAQRVVTSRAGLPWRALLLDSHGGVRALAQHAALEAGADPDVEYRALVASSAGRLLAQALIGLGETGGPHDAELMRGLLADPLPVVRRGALRGLAGLRVDDLGMLARGALSDASPAVVRAARDLGRRR